MAKVAIRAEEQGKKVLCFVTTTYGLMKTMGAFRISQITNREGGVEIPFELYAQNWMDSDLEFYDPETGERLGEYVPPAEIKEREETSSIQEMVAAVKALVELQSLGVLQNMSPELQAQAQALGVAVPGQTPVVVPTETPAPAPEAPVEQVAPEPDPEPVDLSVVGTIMDGKKNWRKRIELMNEQTDVRVVRAVEEELGQKEKLNKTDGMIKDVVDMKLELMQEDEHQIPEGASETEVVVGVQNEDAAVPDDGKTDLQEREERHQQMIDEMSVVPEPKTAPAPPPAASLNQRLRQQKEQEKLGRNFDPNPGLPPGVVIAETDDGDGEDGLPNNFGGTNVTVGDAFRNLTQK